MATAGGKGTAAKAPSRRTPPAAAKEPSGPSTQELEHHLLSEKVRSARLANDKTEAVNAREHSEAGEQHHARRQAAGTREAEAKAYGALKGAQHSARMNTHKEQEAGSDFAHKQRMQALEHHRAAHALASAHNDETRKQENHELNRHLALQRAHAEGRAHRRAALTGVFHALTGGAGGSAKGAMHKQIGGGH